MPVHKSVLRDIARRTIEAHHPQPIDLPTIYAVVEAEVEFDDDDLKPPMHKGKPRANPRWKRNVRNALQADKAAGLLVNEAKGLWRMPTPLPPERELDADLSWCWIRDRALAAIENGTVLRPGSRDERFRVVTVGLHAIELEDLGGSRTYTLDEPKVRRGVVQFNAAGGRTGVATLLYVLADETALVALHPLLDWDETGVWIILDGEVEDVPPEPHRHEENEVVVEALGVEGAVLLTRHRRRERDSGAIRRAKSRYRKEHGGRSPCQLCGFEFGEAYPELGEGYIEAHHRTPLAELGEAGVQVYYDDLAFLCANCHRMEHRRLAKK